MGQTGFLSALIFGKQMKPEQHLFSVFLDVCNAFPQHLSSLVPFVKKTKNSTDIFAEHAYELD